MTRTALSQLATSTSNYDHDHEESSSSDDELIIIPSRTSSFVMPDQLQPSSLPAMSFLPFRRDGVSPSSVAYSDARPSSSSMHSEADTTTTTTDEQSCDAMSELARVVETRHNKQQQQQQQQQSSRRQSRPGTAHSRHALNPTVSFAALAETMPSGRPTLRVRCVCRQIEDRGYFMVQW